MGQCFEVFATWDEEHDKFIGLLRDIAKKKRDDLKSFWRVASAHKKLQSRMEQMRKFRRQHEQLCSVIGRVLPPSLPQRALTDAADADAAAAAPAAAAAAPAAAASRVSPEFALMNAADINAIEEVNLAYDNVKVPLPPTRAGQS